MPLPLRPRLAEHAMARGHVVRDGLRVVLHDGLSGALVDCGLREWLILAAADGTRDIEGLTLAAQREGARVSVESVRSFMVQIAELGWLEDGLATASPMAAEVARDDGAHRRPVEHLPGFALACDGRGSCCRFYPSVIFSPAEAARARAACPSVLDGAARQSHAFFPHRGADARPALAVVAIDGRCAYLDPEDRCAIHAAAGAEAKPFGCRMYPAQLVDDGEVIRVWPALECACVLASLDRDDGAPLLGAAVLTRADLDPAIHLEELGPVVTASTGRVESVAALRAWSRALVAAPPPEDAIASAWALAAAADDNGLDIGRALDAFTAPPAVEADEVLPWVVALAARALAKAHEDARWRADTDLARLGSGLVAEAALSLVEGGLEAALAGPRDRVREAFAMRVFLFGHGAARRRTVALSLRDHAVRALSARALVGILARGPHHPALREPIAVVQALLRGYGVGAYVDDLVD